MARCGDASVRTAQHDRLWSGVLVSGTPAAGTAAMAVVTAPGQLLLWSAAAVMAAPDVVVAVAGQLLLLMLVVTGPARS